MKFNSIKLLFTIFAVLIYSSCSEHVLNQYNSSRDITLNEKIDIAQSIELTPWRSPADISETCFNIVNKILSHFKSNKNISKIDSEVLPYLSLLENEKKVFANNKEYILYQANINTMENYSDYKDFLEQTAEVIFEPVEPFGHIRLRIGKRIYSFNNVKWTQNALFKPRILNSSNSEMIGSEGFVFKVSKQKIKEIEDEIQLFYTSSEKNNVPPFDAYSPLLKIEESDSIFGKSLNFISDSPKFGNNSSIDGKIEAIEGNYFLKANSGLKVPVQKINDTYFTQSYSCSTSAVFVLNKFFNLNLSHGESAKGLSQSLLKGNLNQNDSPIAIIKYYEN